MTSISTYFKAAAGIALSVVAAKQLEVPLISFSYLGLTVAGQIFVQRLPMLAQKCVRSVEERCRRVLSLSSQQLTQPPNLSQTPRLQYIYLDNNQLTQTPNLSQTPLLILLYLDSNELNQAPDVSQNIQLLILDLSNNRLESLHESTFRLSRDCVVLVQGNRFSAEYCQEIERRLAEVRAEDPSLGPNILYDPILVREAEELTFGTYLSRLKIN